MFNVDYKDRDFQRGILYLIRSLISITEVGLLLFVQHVVVLYGERVVRYLGWGGYQKGNGRPDRTLQVPPPGGGGGRGNE